MQEDSLCDQTLDRELTFDEVVADIVKHLKANHANTLPLCACINACSQCQPYRDIEETVDALPVMNMSTQNAHALLATLIDCGAIEAVEVPEPEYAEGEEKQDMPVDYTLESTEAGKAAVAQFEPSKRFSEVLNAEPHTYGQAYAAVLQLCQNGARKADIEAALQGNEALTSPKQIYPSYFISKLETVGGLVWDGSWKTTESGQQMLALVG